MHADGLLLRLQGRPRLQLAPPLPARGAARGVAGRGSGLLELGFVTEGWRAALRPAQATAAAVLALDLLAALRRLEPRWPGRGTEPPMGPYLRRPRLVLRRRWLEFLHLLVSVILLAVVLQVPGQAHLAPHAIQAFLVGAVVLRLLKGDARIVALGVAPELLLIVSFAVLILGGTSLLLLPRAVQPGVAPLQPLEALFTAVSACTVTGLTVRETGATFSGLGSAVILALIQCGALGLITLVALASVASGRLFSVPQMVTLKTLFGVRKRTSAPSSSRSRPDPGDRARRSRAAHLPARPRGRDRLVAVPLGLRLLQRGLRPGMGRRPRRGGAGPALPPPRGGGGAARLDRDGGSGSRSCASWAVSSGCGRPHPCGLEG